jgi:hypothetical protein
VRPEVALPEMTPPEVVNRKTEMKGRKFPAFFLNFPRFFPELL